MPKVGHKPILSFTFLISVLLVPVSLWGQELAVSEEGVMGENEQSVYGYLRSRNMAKISAEFPAKIEALPFQDGENFQQGDVLVRFDCSVLKTEKEKFQAIQRGAQKRYQSEKRLTKLQSGGQLELELAAAKMAEAKADLNGVLVRLEKCELKAPYDGSVIKRHANEHEFLQTGTPIVEIIESRHLEVEFIVPSAWLMKLGDGSGFTFKVGETAREYRGEIIRQGAMVDPVSRTVTMIGRLTSQPSELIAGMSGYVIIDEEP